MTRSRSANRRPARQPAATFPGTVVIDTREQVPYLFDAIRADAKDGGPPGGLLFVPTMVAGLPSGDYSLAGFETRVAVERKSLGDCYSTIGGGDNRARFIRELERLSTYDFAAVVIEANWETIIANPPRHTQTKPKTIFRSIVAFQQRYPTVHWWAVDGRESAERVTFRILERYLRDEAERAKEAAAK